MKLRLLVTCSLLSLLALAETGTGHVAAAERAGGRKITIGFSQLWNAGDWRNANTQSIKDAAAGEGFDVIVRDAMGSQSRQIEAIRFFIQQKVDVIVFSPVVESGWDAVLAEAKAARIPVILEDHPVNAKDDSLWASWIGSDFVEEGRRAAAWVLGYGPIKERASRRTVNIVELEGDPASTPAIERKRGFDEGLRGHPTYKLLRSQPANFDRSTGAAIMQSFLQAYGKDIDVLFAHNDDMALGAIEAIEGAGLKPGSDIVIVSVDGIRAAFQAMVAGKLNATVECNPLLCPQLVKAVRAVTEGQVLPRRIPTVEGVFPADTAATELPHRKY
jgi:galactofuranose transport system substrate-binding protein